MSAHLSFDGRVALITGGSRGIGLAIAQRLVDGGCRVCITGRKPDALKAAVEQLGGRPTAMGVAGSSNDAEHQDEAIRAVLETFGALDVLVNNAGVNPAFGPMLEITDQAMRRIFDVNVIGSLAWLRKAHVSWFAKHGGAVVNVSSVAGLQPTRDIGFYGASKAALVHLTRQLALELAPAVRVNAVAPAVIRTRFAGPLFQEKEEAVVADYPLGRLGEPSDVAAAVAYLASDDAQWITGQVLVVDGGLLLNGGV